MAARKYDAIVIGAGHNGLVAASYLSRGGLSVLMVDRGRVAGGLCVTEEIFPRFRCNRVANSSHNLEPRIQIEMELEKHGLRFAHPSPNSFMAFPDGRDFIAWHDRKQFGEMIDTFEKGDGKAYFETLNQLNELAEVLDVSFFKPPPTLGEIAGKIQTPHQEDLFRKVMFGSTTDLMREKIKSPQVQAALAIVGVSANFVGPSTPGSAYMLFHRPLYRGSKDVREGSDFHQLGGGHATPIGGMGEITQAMRRSIEAAGVTIKLNSEVQSIQLRGDSACGVVLKDGTTIDSSIVLSCINPKFTLINLVPSSALPSDLYSEVKNTQMRGTGFKVNLALDTLPIFKSAKSESENLMLATCGFRTSPSIETMDLCYYEAMQGRWSSEPMIWGLVPSTIDPRMAPSGKHVMSLSVFHAPYDLAEGDWSTEKDRFAKHIINVLTDYIPNLKDIILHYQSSSPKDLESEFGLSYGNAIHGDIIPGNIFSMRPFSGCSDYRTPIKGLYLGSNGVWPANYVSGIPGLNAANAVLADFAQGELRSPATRVSAAR